MGNNASGGGNLVMKYGGSSIANPERMRKVAEHIKSVKKKGRRIVVVLSAMGDTTDDLIKLAEESYQGVVPATLRDELDKLLVTGEEQSAPLLALVLASLDVPAISLTSREIQLEASVTGRVKMIKGNNLIKSELDKGKVVIVTGFQGIKVSGSVRVVTTLGRGGSDVTAVCLAAVLGGCCCENYTDVDGIFATDPRVVPNAKRFEHISYHQLTQLASVGGGKLMDRAVLLAQNLGVIINVKLSPSFGESTGGTVVCSGSTLSQIEIEESQAGLAIQKLNMVRISHVPNQPGAAAKIYTALYNINLRGSIQAPAKEREASIAILFSDSVSHDVQSSLTSLKIFKLPSIKISAMETLAVLTLVDPLMDDRPGYLRDVCDALGEAGINIVSQASPGITIEVMVGLKDLNKAAQAIATKFNLVDLN